MKLQVAGDDGQVVRLQIEGQITQRDLHFSGDPLVDLAGPDVYAKQLLIDLARAPMVDSSGISWLISAHKRCREKGGRLVIHSYTPPVANTLRLLKLPTSVQNRVAAGVLSAGHARAILSAGDVVTMERLADKIVNEDLSVRAAEAAAGQVSTKVRPTKPKAGGRQGQLDEIAERLGDRLDTRVKVTLGASKGTIVIDFATVGDLNRILKVLGQDGFSR
jgi:ParB family chromosome partitioning protein